MLQSACSADATEGAHRHGGAAFAGNDDALWAVRVRPHLMRPALPDHGPPRLSQRCAHLPVLLGHAFDRIARCGHASVLGWPDWPPHNLDGAPPEASVGAPARRQRRGAGTLRSVSGARAVETVGCRRLSRSISLRSIRITRCSCSGTALGTPAISREHPCRRKQGLLYSPEKQQTAYAECLTGSPLSGEASLMRRSHCRASRIFSRRRSAARPYRLRARRLTKEQRWRVPDSR